MSYQQKQVWKSFRMEPGEYEKLTNHARELAVAERAAVNATTIIRRALALYFDNVEKKKG
jgi:hypothetical protein